MASKDGASAGLKSFEQQFRDFSGRIQYFRTCLKDSQDIIATLQQAYKNNMNADVLHAFISEKERQEFEKFASKKASVLVVGQTNSGKSSLINELLGATYLPTAEVPCTSRIVRVRYSADNYLEVRGPSGECLQERHTFKKKSVPRAEIALDDTKRAEKEWVRCVVEVGLNNSLLQGGHLEFVDAPGMSENDVLDAIVQECLHGILQVVFYVIDGHSSLRAQDREFLYSLKEKIGSIPIFFVCNKVDQDERAAEFDRDSDDSDQDLDSDALWKKVQEKQRHVFNTLIRCGFIDSEVELENCEFFHGISTLEVRKARRKQHRNLYTGAFENMKIKFLKFVAESVNSHLKKATSSLSCVQRRIFDFYISRDPKHSQLDVITRDINAIRVREKEYFHKMRTYIKETHVKLQNIISKQVSISEEALLKEAETMEFAPIRIGDIVHRNEIINQCRTQIQKMVLLRVLNISLREVNRIIKMVTSSAKETLEKTLQDALKHDGIAGKMVAQQLRTSHMAPERANHMVQMDPDMDYSLMNLTYQTWDQTKRFFTDIMSIVTGTTVNRQWKRKIAKNVLENIDSGKVSNRVIGTILDDLHSNHESFIMNLRCIEELCKIADKQSESQQVVVSKFGPPFAEVACRTDALIDTLSCPEVLILGQIGRQGKRGTVYDCLTSAQFGEGKVVAKQFHTSDCKLHFIAIQHCLRRIDTNHNSMVLSPLLVVLVDFKLTLLLPRCKVDLYTALNDETLRSTLPLHARLIVLKQMTEACIFCRERGLQLIDPRITNVQLDDHYNGKLDICKPRDDSVPYPDGFAPFHVKAASPPLVHASTKILQVAANHDVYSLGIMGWLLAVGKYIRPTYAKTENIEVIYEAVARGTQPDVDLIQSDVEMTHKGFTSTLLDCLSGLISLWDLASHLEDIFSSNLERKEQQ